MKVYLVMIDWKNKKLGKYETKINISIIYLQVMQTCTEGYMSQLLKPYLSSTSK